MSRMNDAVSGQVTISYHSVADAIRTIKQSMEILASDQLSSNIVLARIRRAFGILCEMEEKEEKEKTD